MYANDIRKKTEEELEELLRTHNKEFEELQMKVIKQKEKNINKVKFARRDIARIKTVMREFAMKEQTTKEVSDA